MFIVRVFDDPRSFRSDIFKSLTLRSPGALFVEVVARYKHVELLRSKNQMSKLNATALRRCTAVLESALFSNAKLHKL